MTSDAPLSDPPARDEEDEATMRSRRQLTARLNRVVNRFAGRDDLVLYCMWRPPEAGEAPAWYNPRAAEVTVNAHLGLQESDPQAVNPLTRAGRRKRPEIIGLVAHEASHAHSTDASDEALAFKEAVQAEDPLLLEVFTLLEEPRIEYRQVQRRPHDRYYLRAQSVMIDLEPFSVESSDQAPELDRWRAATVALLVYGRVDAGILTSYDADHVHPLLVEALGDELLDQLRDVQRRALRVADGDLQGLLECSRQWLELVGRPVGESDGQHLAALLAALFSCGGSSSGEGDGAEADEWANDADEEGDGGGEAAGGSGEEAGGVLSGLGGALEHLCEEVATEVADGAAAEEAAEASHAASAQTAKDRAAEAKKMAKQQRTAGTVFDPDKGSHPVLKGTRAPTAEERRLAREVGQALKRAQFRERTTTKHTALLPPGRLNGRDAMLGEAQKAMGNPVTARPFRTTRSRHAPEPPITLGLMTDYSGSMGWASEALASVSWVFAHAMTHVTGTMASVLFGEKVVPLTRPNERPAQVQEYAATGGWENFGRAYEAINGSLNLTRGQGVRLLVVISDGYFANQQTQTAQAEALHDLKRAGVTVLWAGVERFTNFPDDAIAVRLRPGAMGSRADSSSLTQLISSQLADTLRQLS